MLKFLCVTLVAAAVALSGPLSVKADIAPYPRPRHDEPPRPPPWKPDPPREKDSSNPQDRPAQDRQPPNKDSQ